MWHSLLLIKAPRDWAIVSQAVISLTRDNASGVRYIGGVEELSGDNAVVDIVVMQLYGEADYALEIYWQGATNLPNDAVGMYLANALGSPIIISGDESSAFSWLRLTPDGIIEKIILDIEQLNEYSIVAYKMA